MTENKAEVKGEEPSQARTWISALSDIQKVIDESGLCDDDLYFVLNALHSFNCWDTKEEREVWVASRGADRALKDFRNSQK